MHHPPAKVCHHYSTEHKVARDALHTNLKDANVLPSTYNPEWTGNLTDSTRDFDNFSNSVQSLFTPELNMKPTPGALRDCRICLKFSIQALEIKLTFKKSFSIFM